MPKSKGFFVFCWQQYWKRKKRNMRCLFKRIIVNIINSLRILIQSKTTRKKNLKFLFFTFQEKVARIEDVAKTSIWKNVNWRTKRMAKVCFGFFFFLFSILSQVPAHHYFAIQRHFELIITSNNLDCFVRFFFFLSMIKQIEKNCFLESYSIQNTFRLIING